jgi:hypothetical protein
MSMRYPGGLIASSPVNAAYPSGVWTQAQTQPYAAQNVWMRDQYWPYTTLLLQGNGTNGAQNNTFLDSSTNNFTITRNGNTTQGSFTPYEANGYWSNYFDGSGDWLDVASNAAFGYGTGDFTIEFWVFPTSATGTQVYLDQRAGSATSAAPTIYTISGTIYYYVSGNNRITGGTVTTNQWSHIALCRSGTSTKLFINGVQTGSTYTDSTTYVTAPVRIGDGNDGAGPYPYPGYVSNFRIVKGTALYTAAFTPPTAPLTAITNTSLLTCQSNRFIDNSTNAFAITRNGDTSVQAFQPFPGATTWSGSVLGGSGYFDGTGDYLTAPSDAALAVGSTFTVEFWVYRTVGSTVQWLAGNNAGSGNTSWLIEIEANNTVYGGGWNSGTQTSSTVPVAAWTHIAMVCNSGSLKIYINGVQSGTAATSINFTTSATTYIGQYSGGSRNLTGYISNLRVLKGTALYTADFTPPTSPLTAITNTSLLLNFTNAGIFDSAMMNNLETVGNAQVSTSVVKYGTGSMAFDGTDDTINGPRIVTPQTDFGSGDFTVESWIYINAFTPWSTQYIANKYAANTNEASWYYYVRSTGFTFVYSTDGTNPAATLTGSTTVSTGTWHHVAITRSGNNFRFFLNGTQIGSTQTLSGTIFQGVITRLSVGSNNGVLNINGYMDDFRITKGAARYIGNFTPPVARMPQQ